MNKIMLFITMFFLLSSFSYALEGIRIKDLTIYQNSDLQRSLQNNSVYSEPIKPGEDIEFEITLENKLTEDLRIVDANAVVTIMNISMEKNISEKSKNYDIQYRDKRLINVKLDIPTDAEEILKAANIEIKAQDKKGREYSINWTVYLRIENEDHDVLVYNTRLNQTIVECDGNIELIVFLSNEGRYDESKVALKVENSDLGIQKEYSGISIDQDEKYTKVIDIEGIHTNKTGNYPLDIKSYYRNTKLDDIKSVNLFVNSCKETIERDGNVVENNTQNEEENIVVEEQTPVQIGDAADLNEPSNKTSGVSILMVFLIVLVILIIIILLVALFIGRNE